MGRVIACGDENQAIYGWRGAHANSMDVMGERFNCQDLPLSITYRCPVAVVEHARQWVPELEARPGQYRCLDCGMVYNFEKALCPECNSLNNVIHDPGAPWGIVLGEETDWAGQAEVALGAPLQCAEEDEYRGRRCQLQQEHEGKHQSALYQHLYGGQHDSSHDSGHGVEPDSNLPEGGRGHQEEAQEGITKWRGHLTDFLPGDAILCRVNRPLVAVAFALIRAKVPTRVLGRDIGQGLAALARKLAKGIIDFANDFPSALSEYRHKQDAKLRKRGKLAEAAALHDRLDTLQVFVDELDAEDGLQELLGSITRLFGEAGEVKASVILSTVHKAKGLQWPRVFILDAKEFMPSPWARKDWEIKQEANIQYVAATRTQRELRYISSEKLLGYCASSATSC